ncbi:MAG: alpha/beta hydrolase [Burkholderiales bacterium]
MTTSSFWQASDGTTLHYLADDYTDPWTQPETLVLIHPGMGSALRLYAWVPHLARGYRVIRPDIRGHGKSQPALDKPLTNERLARDLIELLDHLKCERAHVIGASAGGIIAMHAALRFPERFASLGVYAATPGINPERPAKGNWLARVAQGGVRNFLTETMHDRIGDASPAHQKWFLDTAEGVTPEYLGRFVPLMASEYFPEKLSAIACPTLMVVPDPDPMVEAHEYEGMRRYLRNCRYVSIKGPGHSMVGEIPDRCAQEARRFLDDVRAGRPL